MASGAESHSDRLNAVANFLWGAGFTPTIKDTGEKRYVFAEYIRRSVRISHDGRCFRSVLLEGTTQTNLPEKEHQTSDSAGAEAVKWLLQMESDGS